MTFTTEGISSNAVCARACVCAYRRGGYMQISYETMTFLFILAVIGELHGGSVFEM